MAILFRCDVCKKEVSLFWNVSIIRKRCYGPDSPPTVEKELHYDVCSQTCERNAITRILTKILPPEVVIQEKNNE